MKILRARHMGFCYGVKRAVQLSENEIGAAKATYTLGPIIHNPQVVAKLHAAGIETWAEGQPLPAEGQVIIRSHGVGPDVYQRVEAAGLDLIDATCPNVQQAQQAAKALYDAGYAVVIVGEAKHPEVKGIAAWAPGCAVVETPAEAQLLPPAAKRGVVVQTTFTQQAFHDILAILENSSDECVVKKTICAATANRQNAAVELAGQVDVMVVIGGRNSANTTHLYELVAERCPRSYHVETGQDITPDMLAGAATVGITAGASTPDWLIEEVCSTMESMEQEMAKEAVVLQKGDLVRGRVVSATADEVFVDIGYKTEGQISKAELSLAALASAADAVNVGEEIDVVVLNPDADGAVLLSKVKADARLAWDKLEKALADGADVSVTVLAPVKGGLTVDIYGLRGFMPASQTDLHRVEDLGAFTGQTIIVKVIELEAEKKRVVVSRRQVLEAQRAATEAQRYDEIAVGQRLSGKVSRLASFGAFVNVGGIDGLVHISDMAWTRVNDPSEVVSVGDAVEVVVKKVDAAAKRLSLSLRDALPDPWQAATAKLAEGAILTGKVAKLASFGAFVALLPGVEGLVHISEITDHHINKPEDVLSVGQEVTVKVLGIDRDKKRLSLSIKQATEQKEKEEFKDFLHEEESFHTTIGDKFADLAKLLK